MRNGILLAVTLLILTGCAGTARLYPVEGPYSKLSPSPVIEAKMTGMRYNGDISFTLPDGPTCQGEWASASNASVGIAFGAGGTATAIGTGGPTPGQAVATCSDGRRVELQFSISHGGVKSGVGSGKDTQGNVYRFML